MTAENIRETEFATVKRGGYNPEDVDDFLKHVAMEMEALEAARDDAENKMYILAQKVEEYRGLEDTLKTALINAQRMGETVVHEAKQKADAMVREATGKARTIKEQAQAEIEAEYESLEKLRDEVGQFKSTILTLYKQHIESLSALDTAVDHVEEFLDENQPSGNDDLQGKDTQPQAASFSETFEETYEPVPQNFTPLVEVTAERGPAADSAPVMDIDASAGLYPVDAPIGGLFE